VFVRCTSIGVCVLLVFTQLPRLCAVADCLCYAEVYDEQDRQCTCDVTLWSVCVTIVTIEMQQCLPFVLVWPAVNNIKILKAFPWKCNSASYLLFRYRCRYQQRETHVGLYVTCPIFCQNLKKMDFLDRFS
jgi:hypothetical protein